METNLRFKDLVWAKPSEKETAIIIGLGGIGSWLAFFLSRIGIGLYVYDDDVIDQTNMSGQHYQTQDINSPKERAVEKQAKEFSDHNNITGLGKFVEDSPVSPIMFSCLDNMFTRKLSFNKWKEQEDRELFVDGRMLAESFQIFVVQKGQEEYYEKTLFEDEEVPDLDCSAKATSHCGAMIASKMTGIFTNYMYNKILQDNVREIPEKLFYDIELMTETIQKFNDG